MMNLDAYLFDFISQNWFTVSLILGVLKILAQETEWTADDKIISMLISMVGKKR